MSEQLKRHTDRLANLIGQVVTLILRSNSVPILDITGLLDMTEARDNHYYSIAFPGDREYELVDINFTPAQVHDIMPPRFLSDHENAVITLHAYVPTVVVTDLIVPVTIPDNLLPPGTHVTINNDLINDEVYPNYVIIPKGHQGTIVEHVHNQGYKVKFPQFDFPLYLENNPNEHLHLAFTIVEPAHKKHPAITSNERPIYTAPGTPAYATRDFHDFEEPSVITVKKGAKGHIHEYDSDCRFFIDFGNVTLLLEYGTEFTI